MLSFDGLRDRLDRLHIVAVQVTMWCVTFSVLFTTVRFLIQDNLPAVGACILVGVFAMVVLSRSTKTKRERQMWK